jgi:hypothetical protein
MNNRTLIHGPVILCAGLLASSASSFVGHFAIFATATDFASGLLDGLAAVAYGIAIFVLIRSRCVMKE